MNPTLHPLEIERQTKRRRLAIFLLVVVLLVAGGFGARPAYRVFTGWRARRLAAQAEKLLGENQWPQAIQKAQAAFLLHRTEPAALHAMARVLTVATNAAALPFWQQLVLTGHATDPDRREFIELALRSGSPGVAAVELRKLLTESPNEPAHLWLAAQLAAALGDYAQTVHYATRAQLLDPANRQYQLFLASLQFDAASPGPQSEARQKVWTLARAGDSISLEALGFLAARADLPSEQRRELITLLEKHPLGGTRQQLLALDQRLRLTPDQRAAILDAAVAKYKSADPETLAQFAVWLNQHEEFTRTLTALPLDAALARKELFIPHADALAALGRWAELETILDTRQIPLEPVYAEGFRAHAAMQLNNTSAVTLHWNRALWNAERNPEQLTWLAFYAEKCGELVPAQKAWRALIACAADPRPAYRGLQQLIAKSGSTAELGDLLGEMLKHWPTDPALRNDHAYLNLLLAREPAAARDTAQELLTQMPDNLPYRTTLALAFYRLKDFAAALRVYEGRPYDWSRALPGQRAVYAAVLAANGKTAAARDQTRDLPRLQMRPEELDLIQTGK